MEKSPFFKEHPDHEKNKKASIKFLEENWRKVYYSQVYPEYFRITLHKPPNPVIFIVDFNQENQTFLGKLEKIKKRIEELSGNSGKLKTGDDPSF